MRNCSSYLLVVGLVLAGCTPKTDVAQSNPQNAEPDKTLPKSGRYTTPEATFQTAKTAIANGDYPGFCDCWTPEALSWLSGGMAMTAQMFRAMAELGEQGESEIAKQRAARLTKLLSKHGFEDGKVPELQIIAGDNAPKPVDDQVREQLIEIAKAIPDKNAFLSEFLGTVRDLSDRPAFSLIPSDSTIQQISIDGDAATAIIMKPSAGGGTIQECPTTFSKVDGEWKFTEIEGLEG